MLLDHSSDDGDAADDESEEASSYDEDEDSDESDAEYEAFKARGNVYFAARPGMRPKTPHELAVEAAEQEAEKLQRAEERQRKRAAAEARRKAEAEAAAEKKRLGDELAARRREELTREQEEQRRKLGYVAETEGSDSPQYVWLPGALTPAVCALSRLRGRDGRPTCSNHEPLRLKDGNYNRFTCSQGCETVFHASCGKHYKTLFEDLFPGEKFGGWKIGMPCVTNIACANACPNGVGVHYRQQGEVKSTHFFDKDWKDRHDSEKAARAAARIEREKEKQKERERNAQKKQKKLAAAAEEADPDAMASTPPLASSMAAAAPVQQAASSAAFASISASSSAQVPLSAVPLPPEMAALPRLERRKEAKKFLPREQAPPVAPHEQEKLVQRANPLLVIQRKTKEEVEEAEKAVSFCVLRAMFSCAALWTDYVCVCVVYHRGCISA
jgi:hypothetical protein